MLAFYFLALQQLKLALSAGVGLKPSKIELFKFSYTGSVRDSSAAISSGSKDRMWWYFVADLVILAK